MKDFPENDPSEFSKKDIEQILLLENRLKKQTLFFKPKNEQMPEICFAFYNKEGDKEKAYDGGRIKNFVVCKFKECNTVLGCPSGSINTHYESHKTRKRPYETTSSIATFFPQKTTKAEQADITEMLADFCIESGSSFRFATSTAMKNLFIRANNFGIRRNKMLDENFEMPNRMTISRKCYEFSEQILEDKKHLLVDALKNVCGVAVDYGFRKSDFLGAILHWLDENWISKSALLAFTGQISGKTSQETWNKLCEVVSEIGVTEEIMKQQFFVSDEGQNICAAFLMNDVRSIRCICHVINTVAKRIFSPYKAGKQLLRLTDLDENERHLVSEAMEIINAVKNVGTFVRIF